MNLSDRALLVGVTISLFSGEKTDKRVAEEVARNHNTTARDAGRFQKAIVSKKALEDIKHTAGRLRDTHYSLTLPWLNSGERLLALSAYETYGERIAAIRAKFDEEVERFVAIYPDLIEDARRRLNGMFDEADYPPVSEIRRRFVVDLKVMPFPNTRNWLTDEWEEVRAEAERRVQMGIADATRDLFDRVATVTGHMAQKLRDYDPETKTGIFRDSLVENVRELHALLPSLNVTGDERVNELSKALSALTHHDASTLRTDPGFRQDTAAQAETIYQQAMALLG